MFIILPPSMASILPFHYSRLVGKRFLIYFGVALFAGIFTWVVAATKAGNFAPLVFLLLTVGLIALPSIPRTGSLRGFGMAIAITGLVTLLPVLGSDWYFNQHAQICSPFVRDAAGPGSPCYLPSTDSPSELSRGLDQFFNSSDHKFVPLLDRKFVRLWNSAMQQRAIRYIGAILLLVGFIAVGKNLVNNIWDFIKERRS